MEEQQTENQDQDQDQDQDQEQGQTEQKACCACPIDFQALAARVRDVLLKPNQIWDTIKDEEESIKDFFVQYVMPLAAIPVLCNFLGMVIVGQKIPFVPVTFRWGVVDGIVLTIVGYLFQLAFVFAGGLVIEKLAAPFNASISRLNAIRLVAYSATPMYVVGVLNLIPSLGLLGGLVSLYGLYILFQGLSALSGVPVEKKITYYIVSLLSMIGCGIVLGVVLMLFAPSPAFNRADLGEKVKLPGGISVDVGEFEKGMRQLEKIQQMFPQQAEQAQPE